jgi:hypothetical protein
MTFTAFTEEDWQAIRSVRDDWPDGVDWLAVRRRLEARGRRYWMDTVSRKSSGPPAKIRKRLERLLQQIRNLQVEVKSLPDYVLRHAPDSGDELLDSAPVFSFEPAPDFGFKPQEQWLQDWLFAYENADRAPFSGSRDPVRDLLLYESLLEQWVAPLGGKLAYSRRLDGTPYGPLIEFLTITLKAYLGKAPGPHGIAKIIERYR